MASVPKNGLPQGAFGRTPTPLLAKNASNLPVYDTFTAQPSFDERIRPPAGGVRAKTVLEPQVHRGWLLRMNPGEAGGAWWNQMFPVGNETTGYGASKLSFLFNPNTISFTYTNNPTTLPQPQQAPEQQGIAPGQIAITFSFSLLFDRTYEIRGRGRGREVDIGGGRNVFLGEGVNRGVLEDIETFERLVGISPNQLAVQQVPIRFQFGANWSLIGFVTGFSVTITHFDSLMTPMRCRIDVEGTRQPEQGPEANNTTPAPTEGGAVWKEQEETKRKERGQKALKDLADRI